MAQPQSPGARHLPPDPGSGGHKGNGWPVAASCLPMLGGAVALVLAYRAGVAFLILFALCTGLMAVLMAGIGYPHWTHAWHQRIQARRLPPG